jgi:hypothetical protein
MTGSTSLSMGCGLDVNSTSSKAIDMKGDSSITLTGGATLNVTGGVSSSSNATISPSPNTGTTAVVDPFSGVTTPVSSGCSMSGVTSSQTVSPCVAGGVITLTSGISLTGQSSVTLNAGTYILEGGLSLGGQSALNATGGVTLYIPSGGISVAGGATVNLTAPTSGAYQGIAVYQPASNTSSLAMVGGATQAIIGAIYAPGADMSYTGGSSTGNNGTTIVCNSISFVGNSYFHQPAKTAYTGSIGPTLIE